MYIPKYFNNSDQIWGLGNFIEKVMESMLKMIAGFQIKIEDIKFKEKLS